MILGNIYAPLSDVITIYNVPVNELFFPEVLSKADGGVPIHSGDEFILHTPDAVVVVEVLKVKEYTYSPSSTINPRVVKILSFTASTKSTSTHMHSQNCTVIDPFPIYQIYVLDKFMCIALSGDVNKIQTQDGLKQYHILEKYDTVSYLGELYYLCKSLTAKRMLGDDGYYPVYHLLILSKKRPFNETDCQAFINKIWDAIK